MEQSPNASPTRLVDAFWLDWADGMPDMSQETIPDTFLPAARLTGLVEANCSFFFFLRYFQSKEGLNSVTCMTHMTYYDSNDSL